MARLHETKGTLSWKNARRAYWRQRSRQEDTQFEFCINNVSRMRHGLAPKRRAIVRCLCCDKPIELELSLELHHVFGIMEGRPHDEQAVIELWPHEHAHNDPDRKISWTFQEWIGEQ